MKLLIHPFNLIIDNEQWNDIEKQIEFLEFLSNIFRFVDENIDAKILWNNEMENALWDSFKNAPWKEIYNNPVVEILYESITKNRYDVDEAQDFIPCRAIPEYRDVNPCIDPFLKIIHYLNVNSINPYIATSLIGIHNSRFFCECHEVNITPKIVNDFRELIDINEVITKEWPLKKYEGNKLYNILNLYMKKHSIKSLNQYKFNSDFIDKISEIHYRDRVNFIEQMVKRLQMNEYEASNDKSLHDEPVLPKQVERRFRINDSARVHYSYISNIIVFESYYGKSEHDKGLRKIKRARN